MSSSWKGTEDLSLEVKAELEAQAAQLRKSFEQYDPDDQDGPFTTEVAPALLGLLGRASGQRESKPNVEGNIGHYSEAELAAAAAKFEAMGEDSGSVQGDWVPELRAVIDADELLQAGSDQGEDALMKVVGVARQQGHSWQIIGMALGISSANAERRFAGESSEGVPPQLSPPVKAGRTLPQLNDLL